MTKGYEKAKTPVLARLLPNVRVDAETGCWNYDGYITPAGYAQVFDGVHRNAFAHRVMWEELVGPLAPGATIDHLCRNTQCCNPVHLEPVTMQENLLRGTSIFAANARVTECPQGHPYDAENTYWRPGEKKGRDCKKCRATRAKQSRAKAVDGDLVKAERIKHHWTQKQMAHAVGVERSVYQRIEASKKTRADAQVFELIAEFIGVSESVIARYEIHKAKSEGTAA